MAPINFDELATETTDDEMLAILDATADGRRVDALRAIRAATRCDLSRAEHLLDEVRSFLADPPE